jgi:phenylalanyl-tRNA synthetase beta chain
VQVPGWRPDVIREVDLIEEVARLRGYDTFPDELRPYRPTTVPEAPSETTLRHIRESLVRSGSGLLEARTLPLGPADSPDAVAVLNPLSADESHLRGRLLPGLIRRVEHNWSQGQRDVRLFEVGTVFRPSGPQTVRPSEELHLAIVLTGARHPAHWTGTSDAAKLPDMDIWDLKQHFELAVGGAAPFCTVQPAPAGTGWVAAGQDRDGEVWGTATPLEADAPKWAAPLFGLEIKIAVAAPALVRYQPLPTQPPVVRDLSLVLPGGVTAAAIETVLRREGGSLLERLDVLDEYRGPGLPAGTRGVTWRCTFRHPERTLTEREIDALLSRMLTALEVELNVRRRSA